MGISREQALDCFASDDLIGIGMEADAVRRRLHPEGVVTYALDLRFNLEDGVKDVERARALLLDSGAEGLTLWGLADKSPSSIEAFLRAVKRQDDWLQVQAESIDELVELSNREHVELSELFGHLSDAGLVSVHGSGGDGLTPKVWLERHEAAHKAGLITTASMTFGAGESDEERVAFLASIASLQNEWEGFRSFRLVSHHAPGGRDLDDPTAVEYLKTLAICRMMLDNIPNVEADWQQQGLKVLQMALRFGANDVGSLISATGSAPEEEVRRIIRDAGFKPVQRDALYTAHLLA